MTLTEQTDVISARKGEMKFLRAYYYFLLVQSFGGVAIVDERFDVPVLNFARNTPEEVYAFIISEMEEALTLLQPVTSPAFGRVTARAVQHYLAKVHLTRGYETFAANDDFSKSRIICRCCHCRTSINHFIQGFILARKR